MQKLSKRVLRPNRNMYCTLIVYSSPIRGHVQARINEIQVGGPGLGALTERAPSAKRAHMCRYVKIANCLKTAQC